MLAKAGRVHTIRAGVITVLLFAACFIGMRIRGAVVERQNATRAEDLVDELMRADIGQVPAIVSALGAYRAWAEPLLKVEWQQAKEPSAGRLNLSLALLPVDPTQITYLSDQLLVVTPQQFPIVRDALAPRSSNCSKSCGALRSKTVRGESSNNFGRLRPWRRMIPKAGGGPTFKNRLPTTW